MVKSGVSGSRIHSRVTEPIETTKPLRFSLFGTRSTRASSPSEFSALQCTFTDRLQNKTLIHRYLEHLKARASPAAQPRHRVAGSVPYIAGFANMPIHPPIHPSSSAIKTDAEPKATRRKSRLLPSSQIATAIPPYYPGPLKQPAHWALCLLFFDTADPTT
jgi:hypothetical protein